jgi:hypothetical protein
LTASSTYTNGDHPMAQGTSVDPALVDFVSVFPAKWQGLMQLRMYFFAPNRPGYSKTYPAAVIRVTGDRWSVVDGGSVACDVGKAVSDESVDLPASRVNPLNPRSTPGKSVSASVSAGAKPSSPSSSTSAGHVGRPADSSAPTASDGGLVSNAAQSKAVKTSAAGPIWAGAGVLSLLAVAVAVALGVRRRRRKPGAMDM